MNFNVNKYINVNELFFDLIIAFIAGEIYAFLVKDAGHMIESLSYSHAQYVVLIIEFAISYFLGKLGCSFMEKNLHSNSRTFPIYSLLYGIISLYILFMIFISLPPLLNASGVLTYVFGVIVIVFGALAGLSSSLYNDHETRLIDSSEIDNTTIPSKTNTISGKKANISFFKRISGISETISYKEHPILIILPVVALFYTIIFIISLFRRTTGFPGILLFLGSIIAGIIAMYVSVFICTIIINLFELMKKNHPRIHYCIIHILYPAIMAFFITTWSNLYLYASLKVSSHTNPVYVIFLLIVTGIIPIRIFMALNPPVRFANIVISLGALFFFIYSILY